jgi:hypothetical protein
MDVTLVAHGPVDTVVAARTAWISRNKIGGILGTSAQAAQKRCGAVIEQD